MILNRPDSASKRDATSPCAPSGEGRRLRGWVENLLCFFLPVSNLVFLSTAPHVWDEALWWTLPVWLCIAADYCSPSDRREPGLAGRAWGLDIRLCGLFALQMANIFLLLEVVAGLSWQTPADWLNSSANLLALRILAGTSSCCCGIAVAHELIHRRVFLWRWMGRMLLWTVCYDHFAVEHVRGHHRLAALPDDPATARYGELFCDFWRRSVRGQFVNAWRLENQRLDGLSFGQRLIRHGVVRGLCVEWLLLGLIFGHFGLLALSMFLYQSFAAVRLLEAVNYLQHWGLRRADARFGPADAWSTDSWFSRHCFIGLSRHADHHACGGKSAWRLRCRPESPRLPYGYFASAVMIRLGNEQYLSLASRELRARRLGPFRPKSDGLSGDV
ncbi:MAG: fatty acid desaturase [Methylococcaceae bacterium]|nr:fatty acid desaturase [Methylococcaceae bacterium]